MHEMSLVRNIVDIVLEYAEKTNAREVYAVHLTIGNGRDVVIDYLEGLFRFLARNTVAEKAELIIRTTPLTVRCSECGFVFPINFMNSDTWICPACETKRNYRLHSGMEFTIDRIDLSAENDSARETPFATPTGSVVAQTAQ